jgi:predicted amidohydrolase YtcJ
MARNRRLAAVVIFISGFVVFFLARRGRSAEQADLVLKNGRIVTMDAKTPQGQAVAVRAGRIVAVGTDKEIVRYVGKATEVVDLKGSLAIPGFIESHGHFTGLGKSKAILDLTTARSWDDIVAMAGEAAKKAQPGEWILGRGWHQDKWDRIPEPNVDGLPLHDELSRATPDNPVYLTHASGHSALANAKAMESAGVTAKIKNPDGGEVIRDKNGNPIGAFLETAQGLVGRAVRGAELKLTAEEREARNRNEISLAAIECLAHGITTFHDAGASFATVDLYKRMAEAGELGVRLYVMLSAGNAELKAKGAAYRMLGAADDHLTVRAVKRLIDGALGAHGAWLLEPYADLPASTGLNTDSLEELRETAKFSIENDFQLGIHAIGDRANRETLDIYEEAFRAHPAKTGVRWRVEHAQHLSPVDIPRFGALGVIAAMQGIHCTSDGPWIPKRLGPKRAEEGAYVWRKLMESGAVISNGTDVPVEAVDPIACFYATVTRKQADGTPFFPGQRMTREEALRSYTVNGAYAGFEEEIKGSLAPGKLADIAVLSKDILSCPEEEIRSTEVLFTIVGGRILYKKS